MRLENLFVVANTTFQSDNGNQEMNLKEREFFQSNIKRKNIEKMNFNQTQTTNNITYDNSEKNIQNNTDKMKIPQKSKSVKQIFSQFLNIDEAFNKSKYSPIAIQQSQNYHKRSKSVDRLTLLSNKNTKNGQKDSPVLKTFRLLDLDDGVEMRSRKTRTPQMSLLPNGNLSLKPTTHQSHLSLIPTSPQSSFSYQPAVNKAEKTIKNNGLAEKNYNHNISSYKKSDIEKEIKVKKADNFINTEKSKETKESEHQNIALSNANQNKWTSSKENCSNNIKNDQKKEKVFNIQIDQPTLINTQDSNSNVNKNDKVENISSIRTANLNHLNTLKEPKDKIELTNESNYDASKDFVNPQIQKNDKDELKTRIYITSSGDIQRKQQSETIQQMNSDLSKHSNGLQKQDKDLAFKNTQFNLRKVHSELTFASNKQDQNDDPKKKPGTLMIRPASNVSTSLKLSAHLFKLNSYQDITQGSFAPPVQRTEEDKREEEEEKEECENIQQTHMRITNNRSDGKKVKSVLFADQPIVHTFEQTVYSDNEYDYENKESDENKKEVEEFEDYYIPPKNSKNLFKSSYAVTSGSLGTYKSKSLSDISFDFWQNSHQQDFIEQNNESLENEKNIYTSPVEEVEDKFSLATDLIF